MGIHPRQCGRTVNKKVTLLALSLSIFFNFNAIALFAKTQPSLPQKEKEELNVSASFSKKEWIIPTELIGLRFGRPLEASEGTFAVFIGQTDITSLFNSTEKGLNYSSQALPLPSGENTLIVYLVSPDGSWREVATFPLRVKAVKGSGQVEEAGTKPTNGRKKYGFDEFEIKPSLTLNLKAESTLLFFPNTNRPDRINYTDFTFQGSLGTNLARGKFNHQSQFDLVGTTVQKEALRFGEKANHAPQLDLSSYVMNFQVKKMKVVLGHHSYGTNRYLIDGFSSRGLDVTVPIGSRFDLSFNATNGTSIVGWNNFSGLSKQKHKIFAGTLGYELFPKHPGWLRLEAGVLHGSLLPLNNYNQRNLTDAETSNGSGARIVATDSRGRLRVDAGYGRSRFDNPVDPLLSQGFSIVPVRETTRNAQYLDLSYQILKDHELTKDRKVNLLFTFRHNRVEPLFRSVALFTQADRAENQIELSGSIGDITGSVGYNRLNDNLDDIPSILKTLTRRSGFTLGVPLTSVFRTANGFSKWLPKFSYRYDRTHAFGAFLPINSDFALTHVPDQDSTNQSFNAEWQQEHFRFGYRFNQSFQDNREVGRERADFRTRINAITSGFTPNRRLDLNFDLSEERAFNLETNRLDHTLRATFGSNVQTSKKSILAATISSAFAGDRAKTNRSRNADLDLQWSWRFGIEKDKYRKVQGQFFIRYANRYTRATDNIFLFKNLTKIQTMSAGLSLTFF
jgi:hypothetical protein